MAMRRRIVGEMMSWVECPLCGLHIHDTIYPSSTTFYTLSDQEVDHLSLGLAQHVDRRLMKLCWRCPCGAVRIGDTWYRPIGQDRGRTTLDADITLDTGGGPKKDAKNS